MQTDSELESLRDRRSFFHETRARLDGSGLNYTLSRSCLAFYLDSVSSLLRGALFAGSQLLVLAIHFEQSTK